MKRLFSLAAAAALTVLAADAQVIWEGNVSTGNWGSQEGVSCVKIGKASFATAAAGDKLAVTLSEVGQEAKLLYKDGSSWADLVDAPAVEPTAATVANLVLEQTSVDVLKANGLILQGNNVTITKVELTSSSKYEYKEVWNGNQEITWDGETAPRVTDPACADLKAGDVIAVTVSAIGPKGNWPKCCFRSVKDDTDITTLELWDFAEDTMPIVRSVVVENPEAWAYGFYVVGCDASITKMELGFKAATEQGGENVLWEGDATQVSWGSEGPSVSAAKGAKIKAGDVLNIYVASIADTATEEWPKIVCRCADGWDEIFTVELWNDREIAPLVKKVTVTDEMLAALAKGFNFGGSGASINKVTLESVTQVGVVDHIANDEAAIVDVYSISGVRVRANVERAEALIGLPAGMYIVGGKKFIIK